MRIATETTNTAARGTMAILRALLRRAAPPWTAWAAFLLLAVAVKIQRLGEAAEVAQMHGVELV